ncbi:M60 family metallopeptidase [Bacteroides sp. 519]|uniref:M60 family metallopeptidase n=1 Tax=Bacteroides sp. 519 TaxID=2302937 RepID=UPI0013D55820|nr:M60 family metallopeptidase [Bacteroides sp. 519]NDV60663.1 carbohydrate-binding protein [Bacteroides sp. 519]
MKKNILYLFTLLLFLNIQVACSDDKQDPILEVTPTNLEFIKESITKSVSVQTNYDNWQATVDEAGRQWCTATPENNVLRVSVTKNTDGGMRETSITVSAGALKESITVRQLGDDPAILLSEKEIQVEAKGGTISFDVTANIAYEITGLPAWITETTGTARAMETNTHHFTVEASTEEYERNAMLTVKDKTSACATQVKIVQKGTKYVPGQSGIKDDIKLKVIKGEASSQHAGKETEGVIELSFDGKMETIYHSHWTNTADNYFPITLDYYLEGADILDYLVYYPRTSGGNGHFKEVSLYMKQKNSDTFKHILDKDFKGSSSATRIDFKEALTNVDAIRFVVKSGAGDRQGFAACAEMEFYKLNTENFNPLTLFTDVTCTALKPGITEKEIGACQSVLFRDIAMHLLNDTYPGEFRIQDYKAYPHPDDESRANKTSQYSLLDNPTGISVKAGEELIVLVGNTGGNNISLRLQNLDVPGGDGFNEPQSFALSEGINKITPSKSGLLYVMYHTPNFKTAPIVKIHIPTGTVNGYYDSTKHTDPNDWNRLLDAATNDYFDVLGRYAHLTFPTNRFRNHTGNKGKELIDAYDQIVYWEMEHMGLEKYNRMFNNRMYFCVIYTSYMYAAGYHTAYNDNTLSELCNPDLLKTTAIWGPAHEVGHINQTRPGLKWVGTTEVTNNIHSMYVQRKFGNPTRLQTESMAGEGGFTNRYEKAMNLYFRSGRPHCYMTTDNESNLVDVFCKLVPFWQLQLYVTDAQGNKDFYKDLYEMVRKEADMSSEAGHQLEFVVRASKAAKMNLTDFFEKWGFLTEVDVVVEDYGKARMTITKQMIEETKNRVEALGYTKPKHRFEYICDANADLYKTSGTIGQGTASRNDKKVTMNGWTNVVAYEVREGQKLIFVSSASTFTLDNSLASWNNNYKVYAISATGDEVEVKF